jgi:hypothetical protein
MKQNPWEWEESDLEELIATGRQEGLDLDYKESAALDKTDGKKNEVSKDVSAFANSAGGTIVYGMVENRHVPTAIDNGYVPSDITKEWLDQVINSRIQRKIDGVRVNQVQLTKKPGRVAYVVYIPQSLRAPHQAHDKKFYKRYEYQSVPMEEYEVRDVARRAETPILRLKFHFGNGAGTVTLSQRGTTLQGGLLRADIWNDAPAPADYVIVDIFIDERITVHRNVDAILHGLTDIEAEGATYRTRRFVAQYGVHKNHTPVFSDIGFEVIPNPLGLEIPLGTDRFLLAYEIRSPRIQKTVEKFWLRLNQLVATIEPISP